MAVKESNFATSKVRRSTFDSITATDRRRQTDL